MPQDASQRDRVRERFTRTAQQFAGFSLTKRTAEASQLLELAALRGTERALDVACGPGTFTTVFAPCVRDISGIDLTPAMLEQARAAAAAAGLKNISFFSGDAAALPFDSSEFDLVTCGYSVHHFAEPVAVLNEMARVLRAGGKLALVDIFVPEGFDADAANAIERARDASHETTFTSEQLVRLIESCSLRVAAMQPAVRERSLDDWMRIAGWGPGDAAYQETRRLLEAQIENDKSGFAPRRIADSSDLAFVQPSLFLVATK
jgi:ubiquinone/menaquinone biosynthesis C-methylase UbiE